MLPNKPVFFTKEGLEALKKELVELKDKKRPDLVKRVARARDFGDLMENTEYTSARQDLSFVDGRIEEVELILSKAKVLRECKAKKSDEVRVGCQVTVKVNKQKHVYTLVGEWEADPMNKKISHESPLGKALLGRKKGEKVEIEAPAGKIVYEIEDIA